MIFISGLIFIILAIVTTMFISIVSYQYEKNITNQLKNDNTIIKSLIESNNMSENTRIIQNLIVLHSNL